MSRGHKFSSIFFWSILILQATLMGLMLCFFYSLSSSSIHNAFRQELELAASNAGYALSDTYRSMNARLSDLATDNTLRVSLRLDMHSRVKEILEQKRKSFGGTLYLFLPTNEFIPAPPATMEPELRQLANRTQVFNAPHPHIVNYKDNICAIQHHRIILREGRELGELFLVYDLSAATAAIGSYQPNGSADSDYAAKILIEKDHEFFDLQTALPVDTRKKEFTDNFATLPLKTALEANLLYAIPYTSLRLRTNELLLRFALFSLMALGATIFIATLIIRKHSASLQDLVHHTALVASSKDSPDLQINSEEYLEFQDLAASFNIILHNLRSSRDQVNALNVDLEGRVRKRTLELTDANTLLSSREQQLQQVVEHIPVATCIFDTQINPLYASLMWNELFRLSVPHNQGKHFLDLIPEYREYWEKAFSDCMKGKIRHCSEKRMLIHGREYWLRWEAHPWAEILPPPSNESSGTSRTGHSSREKRVGGVIVFMEDISPHKWSQDALQRAADEAGTANRLKSEFLANVSHEIRTPLNCIIGFAEIISASSEVNDIHRHAELILSESDTLLVLINDLLDFSKIEAGKLETDSHDFDLQHLLDDIVPGVRLRLRKKPVTFSSEVAPDVPRFLHGDSFRLRQIIMNLVHNAVKFTERGYIVISVTLSARLPGSYKLMFSVEDTGIGIPFAKQKNIFQKFSQADGSTTRRYGGTGLGTAISKKLVEIMGGSIGLKSTPGKGSTFWFTIPFTLGEELEEPGDTTATACATLTTTQQLPILVAEDYLPNQMVARAHLESAGYSVEIANNGIEACGMVEKKEYSLILMDLSMPEMDGYEATEALRKLPNGMHIPIIALTASAEPSVRSKCLKAKFDDIISKPIRRNDLLNIINKWQDHASGASVAQPASRLSQPEAIATLKHTPRNGEVNSVALAAEPAQEGIPLLEEPVDFQSLQQDYPGKESLICRLLIQFNELLTGQIERLRTAINEQDIELLRHESHKLIGGSGTLRAGAICNAARAINDAAKTGDYARSAEELEIIVREKIRLAEILKKRYPHGDTV